MAKELTLETESLKGEGLGEGNLVRLKKLV